MIIGGHDTARQPLLIAEIGNNHEGDAALAMELAMAAVDAGADAVKVQIIDPERLVNVAHTERLAQLTRFRLPEDVFLAVAQHVRRRGRLFLASVFDVPTLARLQSELDAIKIASGDLDFDPLLEVAASSDRPIILSTGMATLDEIRHALGVVRAGSTIPLADRLAVLHCVSLYPTPLEQANLAAIPQLARALNVPVGYSDHTLGIEAAIAALTLGARIIEKHFTIDKKRSSFRDHALSAEPQEFARLAGVVRAHDQMLGTGMRDRVIADLPTREAARRSVVAARAIPHGTRLQAADLDYVRPADGLSPTQADALIGKRLRRALSRHERILPTDVE
jgi:N-acetylneuraminate synthase/N,N'-diacetyllegionaminate synthase